MKRLLPISVAAAVLAASSLAWAGTTEAEAREGEARCEATAKTPASPDEVVKKVDEAVALLGKEGTAAFKKFRGKESPFIFGGTYIWIHDLDGVMVLHPIKHKMEGTRIMGFKDVNGKVFFAEMNRLVREKGKGWMDYMWPKPGETKPSAKVSYVRGVKTADGKDLVVGSGLYDIPREQMEKLVAGK